MADEKSPLQGLHVLVLEDEMMITMMMEDMLSDLGCEIVGPASNVADALALVDCETIDIGLLDLNLSLGETGYPVADALAARGVPFAFVTGYGAEALREPHRLRATLAKPFRLETLEQLVLTLSQRAQA
jgi:CheY-like chemotaxis protein